MRSGTTLLAVILTILVSRIFGNNSYEIRNGELSVVAFLPLTYLGRFVEEPGFSYLAAALMAVEHFNTRNPVVVSQLAELMDCPFTFGRVHPIDSGTVGHRAIQALNDYVHQHGTPDAIAGPHDEMPAIELSVAATAMRRPLVASRSNTIDYLMDNNGEYAFFSDVSPSAFADTDALISFLLHSNRTDYIAVLYSLQVSNIPRLETFRMRAEANNVKMEAFGYMSPASFGDDIVPEHRNIRSAIRRIKDSGYRTIVTLTSHANYDAPAQADAAEEFGMLDGDYFWLWGGGHASTGYAAEDMMRMLQSDSNFTKMVQGGANVQPVDRFTANGLDDRFIQAWKQQNESLVEKLNQWNPIDNHTIPLDYFQTQIHHEKPFHGSSFIYDALMSIGIGACLANTTRGTFTMTGHAHLAGIRSVDFEGASGHVMFGEVFPDIPGGRVSSEVYYGGLNLLPQGLDGPFSTVTDILPPRPPFILSNWTWQSVSPFFYANGSSSPPELLRDIPNQNYISPAFRGVGFFLFSTAMLSIVGSIAWIFIYREHRVIRAAQPYFLYMLCFGAMMTSLDILLFSFNESHGWDEAMLSNACIASLWLLPLGHIITYGALFSKLWRVNKVLQATRRVVHIKHVLLPFLLLLTVAVILLTLATVLGDVTWVREEINEITGESIGFCFYPGARAYIAALFAVELLTTGLTAYMAWQTKDVDDTYSESSWIFFLILLQLQIMVVGTPLLFILRNVSSDGFYIGFVMICFLMSFSVISMIIGPKVVKVHDLFSSSTKKRGAHAGVVVSGVPTQTPPETNNLDSANASEAVAN